MSREPIVAGTFYEGTPNACRRAVAELLSEAELPADLPETCVGGLTPHAGWICSGPVAALTFRALMRNWSGNTLVLFGAVHAMSGPRGMLYPQGVWRSPLGEVPVNVELAQRILQRCPDVRENAQAHKTEHSLEVQLPIIQALQANAQIVPILVPPSPLASGIGEQVGHVLAETGERVLVVGSTDLTHYGPRYGVTPAGVGKAGITWATENDRRLLRLIESMTAEAIVDETAEHLNACGGGAIAATIAASRVLGASHGVTLRHTNSYEMLKAMYPSDMSDAVGYASVVFA